MSMPALFEQGVKLRNLESVCKIVHDLRIEERRRDKNQFRAPHPVLKVVLSTWRIIAWMQQSDATVEYELSSKFQCE